MRILYVEDSREFRNEVIATHLGDHVVVTADDGAMGARTWSPGVFDIVLLDYEMGGRDGPELLRRIRHEDPEIPVIAVSLDDSLNRRLLDLGATAAVPKRRIHELVPLLKSLSA